MWVNDPLNKNNNGALNYVHMIRISKLNCPIALNLFIVIHL